MAAPLLLLQLLQLPLLRADRAPTLVGFALRRAGVLMLEGAVCC